MADRSYGGSGAVPSLIHLLRSTSGNVALLFGLCFPAVLGAAAFAVDCVTVSHHKTVAQNIADSAALAVAKELHLYRKNLGELESVGKAKAQALLAESDPSIEILDIAIGIDPEQNLIQVDLEVLARTFLPSSPFAENPIRVSSEAQAYGQGKLCVLALDKSKSGTIKADGEALLTAPECSVQSNSTDAKGLEVKDDSRIVSTVICSSGGYEGGPDSFEPKPEVDCPEISDPLADRSPPASSGCTLNDLVIDATTTLSPGTVFCGGLKIEKGAVVTLPPGIYVISGGKLEVKDDSVLQGENVSFYFADDAATFKFERDTTIDLSAPKDGPMAGILFYEDRSAPEERDFLIESDDARRLLGTIYLPKGRLRIDTQADVAAQSAYTVIVAKTVEVKGANLVVNADYGGSDVPVPDGLGPNSQMVRLHE
jgi:Flp pilus assembly protein TadG